jgi:phosphoribosylglycinamide formyltransferase-1
VRLAFLASNNGTSMRAIVAACRDGVLPAEPALVISNKREAPALDFARTHGLQSRWTPTLPDPETADAALCAALAAAGADLVILSGYLRKLGRQTLRRYEGRILNIHPALLPRHGGAGFYGMRVHEAVAAAGESESGVTIHLVDGEYDHGPIVAQHIVPLAPGDDPAAIAAKVTAAEAPFFVATLKQIIAGAIALRKP